MFKPKLLRSSRLALLLGMSIASVAVENVMVRPSLAQNTSANDRRNLEASSAAQLRVQTPLPPNGPSTLPSGTVPGSISIPIAPANDPTALPVNPPTLGRGVDDSYTLGPGDKIQISIFNVPELSGEARVSIDGDLSLPWVGNLSVYQMTITEVKQLLTQQYQRFLTRPAVINVVLTEARPIRVTVSGQVNRPGTYEPLSVNDLNRPGTFTAESTQVARVNRPAPTVTQALQNAGGITSQANIRQILVRRPQRNGTRVAQIDLSRLINQGDTLQDIALRDGDSIVVPMAESIDAAESIRIGTANFAPRNIRVQVVGEVVRPGPVDIANNGSLNQAILAAGGFDQQRAKTSEVEFVRLNQDGSVVRRNIQVDLAAAPNDDTNPLLRENDVIVAQRSKTTQVKDNVGGFLSPLSGAVNLIRLLLGK
jgi:polysaccharide biosynthesis/export protein